ncbi:MAG: hypothetical protein KGY66_06920 [Candidatus Thermoplasmatota archaeon]|nr:hypothetical protein [Candidatus Thermoplasmatota archaeon]MBS3790632.1 hypothetical protein [Candidatus Thermoplasmatota archaeon]
MDLIEILTNFATNPFAYSVVFLIYSILAAVILPIPVEVGLFNYHIHPIILISILALGKGIGAFIVFHIGTSARKRLKKLSTPENRILKKILEYSEWFVKKYGYYGLLIILSTPLMIDSISLYLFSLLNPEEKGKGMEVEGFTIINIIGGALRGVITLAVFYWVGLKLV